MRTLLRTMMCLIALLAFAGVAAAQNVPCPECDADGDAVDSNYYSVDAGLVGDDAEALVDTDAATSHANTGGGFFAWLSVCLSAFLQKVGDAVGVDLDANAEAYVDSDGVDLDATVRAGDHVVDLDDSPVGDVDGMTYEAIAQIEGATGADVEIPNALPETEDLDLDLCLSAEIALATCA